ncbi:MAG: hypothetical protein AB7O62_19935 [Pirellulales bacterium]
MQHRPPLARFSLHLLGWMALVACRGLMAAEPPDRSPTDLVLSSDEHWILTANETADSVSLVEVASGKVVDELAVGKRPTCLCLLPGENRALLTCRFSGELIELDFSQGQLKQLSAVQLGFEPRGVAVSPDGREAFVALTSAGEVAVVDLARHQSVARIPAGQWPRSIAISGDGQRLAVGSDGDRAISVLDPVERKYLYQEKYSGLNAGQMQIAADGQHVYFPWMIYRQNPIDARNIRLGWVLASRIARVRLDGPARREAISLDPPGKAISDPYGMALSSDEEWMVASAPGTHELLVYRLPGLPFQSTGGPGDHIDGRLLADNNRFYRIELGGRPMSIRLARDDRHVYVANYLLNCVQEVDIVERSVTRTMPLGGPRQPSLARQGEAIFYDGRRSLDQWYSCHSCHFEGETNAQTMDTLNDGTERTFKTVLSLHNVTRTPPWTWHGWQQDLPASLRKSLTETMLGPQPTDDDVEALGAYLGTLELPPNPFLLPNGQLSTAAERGKVVFHSEKAGCSHCHNGPHFTDGKIHDVGLGSPKDAFEGFNTPSLLGVYRRVQLLHNGRAKSLREALTELHNPDRVTGKGTLSEGELADLIEYLKTL